MTSAWVDGCAPIADAEQNHGRPLGVILQQPVAVCRCQRVLRSPVRSSVEPYSLSLCVRCVPCPAALCSCVCGPPSGLLRSGRRPDRRRRRRLRCQRQWRRQRRLHRSVRDRVVRHQPDLHGRTLHGQHGAHPSSPDQRKRRLGLHRRLAVLDRPVSGQPVPVPRPEQHHADLLGVRAVPERTSLPRRLLRHFRHAHAAHGRRLHQRILFLHVLAHLAVHEGRSVVHAVPGLLLPQGRVRHGVQQRRRLQRRLLVHQRAVPRARRHRADRHD